MKGRPVLTVEADAGLREHLTTVLQQWGYAPVTAASVDEALAALAQSRFEFSLVGFELNGADGTDFLRRLKFQGGDPGPIIMLFGPGNIQRLGEAAALGADDFIQKPFQPQELESAIQGVSRAPRRSWARPAPDDPTARLEREMGAWCSARMQEVRRVIEQAAQVDITVLIGGETGTGKDLVARAIHHLSARRSRPFVKVNCAAMPRELLESELFGHERGAFTGAYQLKIGKFESANHGTIFLDEIGDLHPSLQAKLLHVLQDGEFPRVGGKSTIKVDVRIIVATNQDLEKAMAAGRFREDLYYRLNVLQIVVPPLRERPEEIPGLIRYFAERYSALFNRHGFTVPARTVDRLAQHRYPGNVRELENMVKRMIVLNEPCLTRTEPPGTKESEDAAARPEASPAPSLGLKAIAHRAVLEAEREAISKVLGETHWNRTKAAKLLHISYRALLYKIKNVGLEPSR